MNLSHDRHAKPRLRLSAPRGFNPNLLPSFFELSKGTVLLDTVDNDKCYCSNYSGVLSLYVLVHVIQ